MSYEQEMEIDIEYEVQNRETGDSRYFDTVIEAIYFMNLSESQEWSMELDITLFYAKLLGSYEPAFPNVRSYLCDGRIFVIYHKVL